MVLIINQFVIISIHALREEGDLRSGAQLIYQPISIHALREEGDATRSSPCSPRCYFYPRPPRGGRPHESCRVRRP